MQEHIGGEFKDIVLETTYMDLNGNLHKINNEGIANTTIGGDI